MEPVISRHLHRKGQALGLPISGIFELTPRCNFNCGMCYVHLPAEEQRRRGAELSATQWISMAEQARDAGTVFLLLTGGEPALRADFAEIYEAIARMGFSLTVNSNGYLLDRLLPLFKRLPPSKFHITLYGTSNKTYEALCGVPAYDRVLANIRALRAEGVAVRVNISLTPENLDDLQSIYETGQSLGATLQAASYMFPPRRMWPDRVASFARMEPETAGQALARFDSLRFPREELRARYEAIAAGEEALELPEGDDCVGHGVACRGGKSSYWLGWDGRMSFCGMLSEPAFDAAALGFSEAWRQLREATAAIRLPKECAGCRHERFCSPCAAKCWCENGAFDRKPDYVCRMTYAYLAALEGYAHEDQ